MKKLLCFLLLFSSQKHISKTYSNNNLEEVIIPVAFHIVYNENTISNISEVKLKQLITNLNTNFRDSNEKKILHYYRERIGVSNIWFCNPTKIILPNGKIQKGISYHKTNKTTFKKKVVSLYSGELEYDKELKSHGYLDSDKYLNIWICDMGDTAGGYSSFPWQNNKKNDGIVLSNSLFIDSTNQNFSALLVTHEVGHYLGLKHIWGRGESTEGALKVNNCKFGFDDEVDDTPRQKGPNKLNFDGRNNNQMYKDCNDNYMYGNFQN